MELTDYQLTVLSTLAWLVLTSIGFTWLVRWSTGDGSWSVIPGLVRGVRGWVDDRAGAPESARSIRDSAQAVVVEGSGFDPDARAEIIDL